MQFSGKREVRECDMSERGKIKIVGDGKNHITLMLTFHGPGAINMRSLVVKNVASVRFHTNLAKDDAVPKLTFDKIVFERCGNLWDWSICPLASPDVQTTKFKIEQSHPRMTVVKASVDGWDLSHAPTVLDHLQIVNVKHVLNTQCVRNAKRVTLIGVSGLINLRGFVDNASLDIVTIAETPYAMPHILCLSRCAGLRAIFLHEQLSPNDRNTFLDRGVQILKF
jgi:hypothetical protein